MKWYKRDPEAFAGGTAGLSLEETGAYDRILDLLYSTDDRVPNDDRFLAQVFRCDIRIARRLKNRLVTLGKLCVADGFLHNARVTSEIREWQHRMDLRWQRKQQELRANLQATSEPLPSHFRATSPPTVGEKANENNENNLKSARTTTTTTTTREESKEVSMPRKRGRPKVALPDNWHPMEALSSGDHLELERFKDHARTNDRHCADWFAAWRNWKRSPYRKAGAGNAKDQRRQSFSDALDRLDEYADGAGAPPALFEDGRDDVPLLSDDRGG